MDIQTRYANCGTGRVAYQIVGDGPVDMVFMSAWFSHVDGRWEEPSFARMLRTFASFSRLLVFDKRGSGASDPLPENNSWEDWADDIRCVMDDAGSEKAAIVGVGDSGPIAMLFAATYPERVSSLVIVNTAAKAVKSDDYPWGREIEDVGLFVDRQQATWGSGGMLDILSPSKAEDPAYRRWWAKYQRMSASPSVSTAVAKLVFQMDVRQFLGTIQVPTLVVHRDSLPMVSVENGRYLADKIPNAKYLEVPGQDYFIYLGKPDIIDAIEEFITGARPDHDVDRVLATVLFTDIVGSTDRAVALGDRRWKELLDTHDSLVKQRLEEFRGRFIKSTGDGLLATFDGPARAIRSAFAIKDSLGSVGIEIRSGLHTGEVEIRGEDVGGIAVHIGARIMSAANAHEVLVSSTVKDLTAGSGIDFVPRGEHELKGVPDKWRLFSAVSA